MPVFLILLGSASIAYGVSVMLVWSGSAFFAIWYAIGAALVGWGIAIRTGKWRSLPRPLRRVIGGTAVCAFALTLGAAVVILAAARSVVPARLDALIVLGAQICPDGSPSTVLRYRLDTAAGYLLENPSTNCLVSGGRGANEPCAEAEAMARYLESRGIDAGRIELESASVNTAENLRNSKELLGSGDERVGIVTNDFHVLRATSIARKQGYTNAFGIAATSDAWYLPNNVLREVAGIAKDSLVGNL